MTHSLAGRVRLAHDFDVQQTETDAVRVRGDEDLGLGLEEELRQSGAQEVGRIGIAGFEEKFD